MKGSDGTAIPLDGIIPAKKVRHNQSRGECDNVLTRALFIGHTGRPGLRPIGPIQVVQQLGPFLLGEPVRLEPVRFVEYNGVPHDELLKAAQQLALLDVEDRVVRTQPEVLSGSTVLEWNRRVHAQRFVDHGLDQVHLFDRVEGQR